MCVSWWSWDLVSELELEQENRFTGIRMGGSTQVTPQKNMVWDRHTRTSRFYTHKHAYTHTQHISPQQQGSTCTIQRALPPRDNLNHLACQSETKYMHRHTFKNESRTQHTQGRGTVGGFQQKVRCNYGQRNGHSLLSSCLGAAPHMSWRVVIGAQMDMTPPEAIGGWNSLPVIASRDACLTPGKMGHYRLYLPSLMPCAGNLIFFFLKMPVWQF